MNILNISPIVMSNTMNVINRCNSHKSMEQKLRPKYLRIARLEKKEHLGGAWETVLWDQVLDNPLTYPFPCNLLRPQMNSII